MSNCPLNTNNNIIPEKTGSICVKKTVSICALYSFCLINSFSSLILSLLFLHIYYHVVAYIDRSKQFLPQRNFNSLLVTAHLSHFLLHTPTSCTLHSHPLSITETTYPLPSMSARSQGFAFGLIVGIGLFLTKKFDVQTQYDTVSRDIQRFHLAINPKFLVDQPLAQPQVVPKRDWLLTKGEDSQQAIGKRPSDAWNRHVISTYKALLTRIYAIPAQAQQQHISTMQIPTTASTQTTIQHQ